MSAVDPKGEQLYYVDGDTFQGVRFHQTKIGENKYWVDGLAEENLTPLQNFDTGKFFLLFE